MCVCVCVCVCMEAAAEAYIYKYESKLQKFALCHDEARDICLKTYILKNNT